MDVLPITGILLRRYRALPSVPSIRGTAGPHPFLPSAASMETPRSPSTIPAATLLRPAPKRPTHRSSRSATAARPPVLIRSPSLIGAKRAHFRRRVQFWSRCGRWRWGALSARCRANEKLGSSLRTADDSLLALVAELLLLIHDREGGPFALGEDQTEDLRVHAHVAAQVHAHRRAVANEQGREAGG